MPNFHTLDHVGEVPLEELGKQFQTEFQTAVLDGLEGGQQRHGLESLLLEGGGQETQPYGVSVHLQ